MVCLISSCFVIVIFGHGLELLVMVCLVIFWFVYSNFIDPCWPKQIGKELHKKMENLSTKDRCFSPKDRLLQSWGFCQQTWHCGPCNPDTWLVFCLWIMVTTKCEKGHSTWGPFIHGHYLSNRDGSSCMVTVVTSPNIPCLGIWWNGGLMANIPALSNLSLNAPGMMFAIEIKDFLTSSKKSPKSRHSHCFTKSPVVFSGTPITCSHCRFPNTSHTSGVPTMGSHAENSSNNFRRLTSIWFQDSEV